MLLIPESMQMANTKQSLVISVVSHGHGAMVQQLLQQLASELYAVGISRVVLTLNVPEALPVPPAGGWPFQLDILRNMRPQGFSFNHNQALAGADENFYCLINPDVDLSQGNPFPALIEALQSTCSGLAYPRQINGSGGLQDSERAVPTPWALFKRYAFKNQEQSVDWVNAAFWLVKRSAWQSVQGLDAGFFMYCEDVDFCLRLRAKGWKIVRADAQVIHAGQRASHRDWRHFGWHIRALMRLWTRPVFWRHQYARKEK